MLILGAISGIQDFVFAVPEEGGGQARMLRARSFFVQALAEAVAFRTQQALGLARDTLVFCAAGRFGVNGAGILGDIQERLRALRAELEMWLLRQTAGRLRITIISEPPAPSGRSGIAERYERTLAALLAEKYRAWVSCASGGERWASARLILPSSATDDGELFYKIGRALPQARWLVMEEASQGDRATEGPSFDLAGFRATLFENVPRHILAQASLVADLAAKEPATQPPAPNRIHRPLARYIPTRSDGSPMWFEELAQSARGRSFLGVLKMDVDSLGAALSSRLRDANDFKELTHFSAALDQFFAVELNGLLGAPEWRAIYTVFSGGDDLLLVGPWNLMLDFAGQAQQLFAERFGKEGLTISGGLAVAKYRYPIAQAVRQAEDLLHMAKSEVTTTGETSKDRIAAFGQVWRWRDHAAILERAKRLASWVENGVARRGWLHTLLRLALLSLGEIAGSDSEDRALAPARLAYHVARNYPRPDDRDPERRAFGVWANRMVARFNAHQGSADPEVLYLPAILRYALLATRP